jgi:hypothetical protein
MVNMGSSRCWPTQLDPWNKIITPVINIITPFHEIHRQVCLIKYDYPWLGFGTCIILWVIERRRQSYLRLNHVLSYPWWSLGLSRDHSIIEPRGVSLHDKTNLFPSITTVNSIRFWGKGCRDVKTFRGIVYLTLSDNLIRALNTIIR